MQQNADLVPVLCFGELNTLQNFIDLPSMQVRTMASCLRFSTVPSAVLSAGLYNGSIR